MNYQQANKLKRADARKLRFVALDGRVGFARGVDFGLMHTWDVSEKNENAYATIWGDLKFQLTNRENLVGPTPILSLGLMKGYVYDRNIKTHITSVPVAVSFRATETMTPSIFYRHEYFSSDFVPRQFKDPRSTFGVALEVALSDASRNSWLPKVGFSVGTFNSLTGGEGDRGLILNVGLTLDSSPPKP